MLPLRLSDASQRDRKPWIETTEQLESTGIASAETGESLPSPLWGPWGLLCVWVL